MIHFQHRFHHGATTLPPLPRFGKSAFCRILAPLLLLLTFPATFLSASDSPPAPPGPFSLWDANADGEVVFVEFALAQRNLFYFLDHDEDGRLSMDEYANRPPNPALDNLDFFVPERLDQNRDGAITLAEYGGALRKAFQALDTILDGTPNDHISLPEFQTATLRTNSKP